MDMIEATRKRNYADFAADALSVETDLTDSSVPIPNLLGPHPSTARAPSPELVPAVKMEAPEDVESANRNTELHLSGEHASDPRSSEHGDDEQMSETQAPEPHVLESGSVKVIIGQGNVFIKEFVIHADLFKHLSGRLHKIIQSREREDYEVVLEPEDADTFTHVMKLAYKLATTDNEVLEAKTKHNWFQTPRNIKRGLKRTECDKRGKIVLTAHCLDCAPIAKPVVASSGFDAYLRARQLEHRYRTKSNTEHPLDQQLKLPDESNVLAYAKVYCFAVKYAIRDLDVASIRALDEHIADAQVEKVVDLFSYLAEQQDKLVQWRHLVQCVIRGASGMLSELMADEEFASLIKAHGKLQFELLKYINGEMIHSRSECR